MKNKKKQQKFKTPLTASNLTAHENIRSLYDPNGSYTGTPEEEGYPKTPDGELPVQDADDL